MELSNFTMQVLKNFASVNSNVVINPGNTIMTMAEAKNVLASATVVEDFPKKVGIYDLQEFLNVLSLVDSPRVTFEDDHATIGDSTGRNMFLRWMVRRDTTGVDFGIWNTISPGVLSCPLDVHSAGIARKLGILTRKQNDGKALGELDKALREMDPIDPVKYDFALFGLGAFEKF